MGWLILIGLALLLIAGVIAAPPRDRAADRERRHARRRDVVRGEVERDPILDHVERDAAGALAKYGTPEDAARLQEQGIDLGALGYRPEGE